jgi:hypothetical protein
MRQRDHFGEAMSGIPGAFLGEAIRTLIQIDALQTSPWPATGPRGRIWQPTALSRFTIRERRALVLHSKGDIRSATCQQVFGAAAPLELIYVAQEVRRRDISVEERRLYASVNDGFIGQNVYLFCASEELGACFECRRSCEARAGDSTEFSRVRDIRLRPSAIPRLKEAFLLLIVDALGVLLVLLLADQPGADHPRSDDSCSSLHLGCEQFAVGFANLESDILLCRIDLLSASTKPACRPCHKRPYSALTSCRSQRGPGAINFASVILDTIPNPRKNFRAQWRMPFCHPGDGPRRLRM